jgi:hypothetical protein
MKKPGMAGLLKGFPYATPYQPRTTAEALNASCHFTPAEWNAMPDLKKTPVNDIIKDKSAVCTKMRGQADSGAIGLLAVFAGKKDGDLIAGEEMLNYACSFTPQEEAAIKAITAAAEASKPFAFPEDMPEATPAEVTEACRRMEGALNSHPGVGVIMGKAKDKFPDYDSGPMVDMVKQSCADITGETIAAAPSPQSLLDKIAAANPGSRPMTLDDAALDGCTTLKKNIKEDPGFNAIFSKNPEGFIAACDAAHAKPKGP